MDPLGRRLRSGTGDGGRTGQGLARSGVLHISLLKTGTTSCPEALAASREILLEPHSHFYPAVAFSYNLLLSVKTTAIKVTHSSVARNESMSMLATLLLSSLNRQRPRFVDGRMNPERRASEIRLFQQFIG